MKRTGQYFTKDMGIYSEIEIKKAASPRGHITKACESFPNYSKTLMRDF